MRPCSSEWTRCWSPGLCAYGPSSAATGLCRPEVGGFVRYFTLEVVCPRPSVGKLRATQPDGCVALGKLVTRCGGVGADGKSAVGAGRPRGLARPAPPPLAEARRAEAAT